MGDRFVESILTEVTSLRQQRRDVVENLTTICSGQPCNLLPDSPEISALSSYTPERLPRIKIESDNFSHNTNCIYKWRYKEESMPDSNAYIEQEIKNV